MGSVFSPLFYNVYLDEMLKSQPVLREAIRRGNLKAFAEEVLLRVP